MPDFVRFADVSFCSRRICVRGGGGYASEGDQPSSQRIDDLADSISRKKYEVYQVAKENKKSGAKWNYVLTALIASVITAAVTVLICLAVMRDKKTAVAPPTAKELEQMLYPMYLKGRKSGYVDDEPLEIQSFVIKRRETNNGQDYAECYIEAKRYFTVNSAGRPLDGTGGGEWSASCGVTLYVNIVSTQLDGSWEIQYMELVDGSVWETLYIDSREANREEYDIPRIEMKSDRILLVYDE